MALTPEQQQQVTQFNNLAQTAGTLASTVLGDFAATASAAGPAGAVVALAVAAIGAFRSTTHLVANEWVQQVQNPFGTALSAIANQNANAIQAGTATRLSVEAAQSAVNNLWTQYKNTANQWIADAAGNASLQKQRTTVINQSYQTIQPLIDKLNADMTANIASLPIIPLSSGTLAGIIIVLIVVGGIFLFSRYA